MLSGGDNMAKEFAASFYASKLWKMKRKEILRRDNYTCKFCNQARATDVHHIVELSPENIDDPMISLHNNNLIAVCADCHRKHHRKKDDGECNYTFDQDGMIIPYPRVE